MPKKAARAQNKSEFVRSMPEGLSAAEVVAKAKAAGMSLTAGHVYTIRAASKRKQGVPARGGRRGRPPRLDGASNGGGSRERQFIALALDLGLSQAEGLLARIKSNVRGL